VVRRIHRDAKPRYRIQAEDRGPVLCLAGEVGWSTPPPVVKAMAGAIPGARFAVLPGAPHMPFVEMPEDVARVVGGFWRETLGRSTPGRRKGN
jgi:pimeloyl-ACP methyl ester carboxylesterase